MKTFVIAEAAGCHDGDFGKARELVTVAAAVGADAVKFQWLSSPERLAARRNAREYMVAYETLAVPISFMQRLAGVCERIGIEFMCTVYLPEDIYQIEPLVKRFKVASFEASDAHFLALHAEFKKPIIVSAGLGQSAANIVQTYKRYAAPNFAVNELIADKIQVLHCVSAYPCPPEQINLRRIHASTAFDFSTNPNEVACISGLSDHTKHPLTGALAVAAGAKIIEFHYRLPSTSPKNADYEVARTPAEAEEYVQNIRLAETMMGDGKAGAKEAELPMLKYKVAP